MLSELLKKAIEESGISTAEYARNWEVPRQTLVEWLHGSIPSSKIPGKNPQAFSGINGRIGHKTSSRSGESQ
jgi:hypothetical protein